MDRIARRARLFGVLAIALTAVALPLAGPASADHGSRLLDVEPETASLAVGAEHTITADLCIKDTSGIPATCDTTAEAAKADFTSGPILIDFELESGPNDTDGDTDTTPDASCVIIAGQSSCSTSYFGDAGPGTDVWRVWIDHGGDAASEADPDEPRNEDQDTPASNGTDCTGAATPVEGPPGGEPDCTDVVNVTWTEPAEAPATVDCDDPNGPDTENEVNPSLSGPQSSETYTCQVRDENGTPVGDNDPNTGGIQDVVVNGEVENDVNDPDGTDGTSYESPDYQCTAGDDDDQGDPPVGQCQITVTQGEGETGTAEICFWIGTDPAADCGAETDADDPSDTGSNTTGNDKADQVKKTWEARSAGEGKGGLDAEPETASTVTGPDHEIAATVYDQFGDEFQGNTPVKFEFFTGSPSDADGNNPAVADLSCTTNNSSSCSVTYSSGEPGRDLVCVWTNDTPAMTGTNQGGQCGGEGLNDGDDAAGSADAPEPPTDDIDVVSKTWTNPDPATELDCVPETDETSVADTHTFSCTASNESGTVEGTEIDAEFTGANDADGNSKGSPDDSCTTGNDGECEITHTTAPGADEGTTTYTNWIDADYFNGGTPESDNGEGPDEAQDPGAAEPDGTDVVLNDWVGPGERRITIAKSAGKVQRGEKVTISGEIKSPETDCEVGQSVRLRARRPGEKFRKIKEQITGGNGEYEFKVTVYKTRDYRTVTPKTEDCVWARSRTVRVKRA